MARNGSPGQAVRLSKAREESAELILAGKPGAKELGEKALPPVSS